MIARRHPQRLDHAFGRLLVAVDRLVGQSDAHAGIMSCGLCVSTCTGLSLPPTQVGLARLAHYFLPNPGKPGFGCGEGGERIEPGGGTTLAPRRRLAPTPDPSPPRAPISGVPETGGFKVRQSGQTYLRTRGGGGTRAHRGSHPIPL